MRIAFSTLGCPNWTFDEIFATAVDFKFDGIEIRGVGNELFAPNIKEFNEQLIEATKAKLKSHSIEIPILTSGAVIGDTSIQKEAITETKAYIDLASKLCVKYVRVIPSANTYPEETDIDTVINNYIILCDYAKDKNVSVLLETNGALADTKIMKIVMEKTNRINTGVLWDVHHPYRFFNETPKQTIENIGKYIKHIHVKDSSLVDNNIVYRMVGYGDVPILDCLKNAKENGFDGFVSIEWVKRWCRELEEAGIVFPQFMSYMKHLESQI